ncbi:MAG: LapA family protein [Planctomycetota bacterium]|jgi:uncharacterized integral membrane protein
MSQTTGPASGPAPGPATSRPIWKRPRVVLGVLLAVLTIITVLQNTEDVSTRILFFTVTMPRAVLLFVTLLVGFILGMVVATRLDPRAKAKPPAPPPKKT